MQELLPVAKANALAAAGFAVIMALVNRFIGQNTLVLMGITIAYVLIMNRWAPRVVPPPPKPKERKGSFKPEKVPPGRQKWEMTRWTLKMIGVGMGVQMVVFAVIWSLLTLALQSF